MKTLLPLLPALLTLGCVADLESTSAPEQLVTSGINADGRTVGDMVHASCTTASIKGLSLQLLDEIECMRPGTMKRIPQLPNLEMTTPVIPFLQAGAVDSLVRLLNANPNRQMRMTSALRTLPQGFLIRRWFEIGGRGHCGILAAAPVGTSRHESGLAIDISTYSTWRRTLTGSGQWSWLGAGDAVHFDYLGASENLHGLSVLAFQRLWKRNNPSDTNFAVDGILGAQTLNRLSRAPAVGFPIGAQCNNDLTPQDEFAPIEVYWARNPDGSYKLRALAPSNVVKVEYKVDQWVIAEATRENGGNFPEEYTFSQPSSERSFQVLGFDKDGRQVGLGVGLIDVTDEVGVYIRQLGKNLYSVGLERAPDGVAYLSVEVDGYPIGDSRGQGALEVRHTYSGLGQRNFAITTYNADGSVRGTLRRTFELR